MSGLRTAGELYSALLDCLSPAEVRALMTRHIIGRPVGDEDVSALITPNAREVLGLPEGPYSLWGLARALQTYGEASA